MPAAAFMGRWNIFEMQHYDRESIDLMGPAHVAFDADGGTFGFICVTGEFSWKLGKRGRVEALKFAWDGNDEISTLPRRPFMPATRSSITPKERATTTTDERSR